MSTDIDTIEDRDKDTDELPEEAEIIFTALDKLIKECSEKSDLDTIADSLISVGFDMTMHIAEHALPGGSFDEKAEAVREHLDQIIEGLITRVWKPQYEQKEDAS